MTAVFSRPFSVRRLVGQVSPLAFCAKLAIVRTVVDVAFAGGHWLIHRPAVWSSVISHRYHHEHKHPSILTNQHFSVADLFVEAYLPAIVGMLVLELPLGIKVRNNI